MSDPETPPVPSSDPGAPPPKNGILQLVVICVTFLIALDLVGTALIRLETGETPTVFGDISKMGIGALVAVIMDRTIGRH